jgi:hypothetical protein
LKELWFPASAFGVRLLWFWRRFSSSTIGKVNYFECDQRPREQPPMGTKPGEGRVDFDPNSWEFFCSVSWFIENARNYMFVGLDRVCLRLKLPMGVKKSALRMLSTLNKFLAEINSIISSGSVSRFVCLVEVHSALTFGLRATLLTVDSV